MFNSFSGPRTSPVLRSPCAARSAANRAGRRALSTNPLTSAYDLGHASCPAPPRLRSAAARSARELRDPQTTQTTQTTQPVPNRPTASTDPSAGQHRTEYAAMRTELLQAVAEAKVPGSMAGQGMENATGNLCMISLDDFVPTKSAPRSRENVTTALRARGWKQVQAGAPTKAGSPVAPGRSSSPAPADRVSSSRASPCTNFGSPPTARETPDGAAR